MKTYKGVRVFHVVLLVKNPPANAGDLRDTGWIPGWERSPGVGNGNLLQYSCLENPLDTGACWATVHRVAKSRTQLKQQNMYAFKISCSKNILLLKRSLESNTFLELSSLVIQVKTVFYA